MLLQGARRQPEYQLFRQLARKAKGYRVKESTLR